MKLLLLLIFTSCAAQMQKTVIAKGAVYNWEVADFVQSGETVRGFSFSYRNADIVPYTKGNIGFIDINEIIDFRDKLYFYANLKCDYIIIDKGYGYRIECGVRSINIFDNHGCRFYITKANAILLAEDLQRGINLF